MQMTSTEDHQDVWGVHNFPIKAQTHIDAGGEFTGYQAAA